jgi:hypothetical protein
VSTPLYQSIKPHNPAAQVVNAGDSFSHLKLNILSFLHNSLPLQLCINQSKGGYFHQENQECGRSFKLDAAGSEATRRNFFSNRVVEAWNMVPGVIKR